MLTRALDEFLLAADRLPHSLQTLRRSFGGDPVKIEALERLEGALKDAKAALSRHPRADQ